MRSLAVLHISSARVASPLMRKVAEQNPDDQSIAQDIPC